MPTPRLSPLGKHGARLVARFTYRPPNRLSQASVAARRIVVARPQSQG
jgi:hypothetical protein